MGLGSSCVRHCDRAAHEYATEDCLTGPAGVPGLSSGSAPGNGGNTLRVGDTFNNAMSAVKGNDSRADSEGCVPPVPNWFQALKKSDGGMPKESTRFFEVTPRGTIGGEFSSPAASPNASPQASPRTSPRTSPRSLGESKEDAPKQVVKNEELHYEGEYRGSQKHGKGRLQMNGCVYDGQFVDDQRHGQGALSWDDGRQYRGSFERGKFHGYAIMTWPDRRKYTGQYVEDRKHGEGTFAWQDGRRYEGQWILGKRHGVGVYTNAKGFTRTGVWQMDRPLHWDVPGTHRSLAPEDAVASVTRSRERDTTKMSHSDPQTSIAPAA